MHQGFKNAQTISIYKRKGDRSYRNNYRDISLLSEADTILTRVLLKRRVKHLVDDNLSKSQFRFRVNRGP